MNQPHLNRQLPPLAALRVFEAAARHLNFKRAADELALTPTAVSHQIRGLEQRLGLPLFERHARGVTLTHAGQTLFPAMRDALDGVAHALSNLRPGSHRRIVTVSVTRAFAARWLVPRLGDFAQAVPDLDLHLHASDAPVELRPGTVDLAVRYGGGRYPGLRAEPLMPGEFLPVCSPRWRPADAEALAAMPLLAYEWRLRGPGTPDWPRWFREAGVHPSSAPKATHFSDEAHAIQAAIAGHGVVLASRVLVAEELANGTLHTPLGPVLHGLDMHLVWRPEQDGDDALTQLRQWLREQAEHFLRRHAASPGTRRSRRPRRLSP
ncbi:transcriptional regulator GcvA [Pseudoxanthomonas putridarboris]|uniref:Transcriptional regulator GcvA n=1 Tax=Pseudoxanthomonas putridarboris TaxID=752605 RepID=A0ABU9J2N0_9GAMM